MFCPRANFCERSDFLTRICPSLCDVYCPQTISMDSAASLEYNLTGSINRRSVGSITRRLTSMSHRKVGKSRHACMMFLYFYYYHKKCLSSTKCIGAPPFISTPLKLFSSKKGAPGFLQENDRKLCQSRINQIKT